MYLEGDLRQQGEGGGDLHWKFLHERIFRTGFISHSGLKIERETSHASGIFYPQEAPA